ANLRACRGGVPDRADEPDAEPTPLRQIVVEDRDAALFARRTAGAGDEIKPAVVVDVAETGALVHRRADGRRQAPTVVGKLEPTAAQAAKQINRALAINEDVGDAVVVEVGHDRPAPVRRLQPAFRLVETDDRRASREVALAVVE